MMLLSPIEIHRKLVRALQDPNEVKDETVVEIVDSLQKITVTRAMLESLRIGKMMNDLRKKIKSVTLARSVKQMIRDWNSTFNVKEPSNGLVTEAAPADSQKLHCSLDSQSASSLDLGSLNPFTPQRFIDTLRERDLERQRKRQASLLAADGTQEADSHASHSDHLRTSPPVSSGCTATPNQSQQNTSAAGGRGREGSRVVPGLKMSPACPRTDSLAATPSGKRRVISPAESGHGLGHISTASGRVASPAVSRRVASPAVSGRVASPAVLGCVASPAVSRRAASPAVLGHVASPAVSKRAASPAVSGRVASPSVSGRVASPSVSGHVTSLAASKRVPSPLVSEHVPSPLVSERVASRRVRTPLPATHPSALQSLTPAASLSSKRGTSPSINGRWHAKVASNSQEKRTELALPAAQHVDKLDGEVRQDGLSCEEACCSFASVSPSGNVLPHNRPSKLLKPLRISSSDNCVNDQRKLSEVNKTRRKRTHVTSRSPSEDGSKKMKLGLSSLSVNSHRHNNTPINGHRLKTSKNTSDSLDCLELNSVTPVPSVHKRVSSPRTFKSDNSVSVSASQSDGSLQHQADGEFHISTETVKQPAHKVKTTQQLIKDLRKKNNGYEHLSKETSISKLQHRHVEQETDTSHPVELKLRLRLGRPRKSNGTSCPQHNGSNMMDGGSGGRQEHVVSAGPEDKRKKKSSSLPPLPPPPPQPERTGSALTLEEIYAQLPPIDWDAVDFSELPEKVPVTEAEVPVTEKSVDSLHNERRPGVNGMFDIKSKWTRWQDMLTLPSYEDQPLHILPYVDLDT